MRAHERRRRSAPLNCAHPQQPCPSLCPKIHLNAVAVGELAVATAGIVRVEEIVVVVLVRLPLAEGEANREDDSEEHEAERVIVDAEGLRGAMCDEGGDERRGWVVGQARVSRAGSAQQLQAGASPAAAMQVNCAFGSSSQSQAQRDTCARRAQGRGR